MLCRSCYREIPDGTKFCPECGAPTEASASMAMGDVISQESGQTNQYDQSMNGQGQAPQGQYPQGIPTQGQYQQPQYQQGQFGQGGFQQGHYQQGQVPPNQGYYNQTPPPARPKQSGMSTAAMILGILTCTAILGFIIGLIDLIKNKDDGNKHGGSIFAVVWGGIILLATISNAVRLGHDRNTNDTRATVESAQSDSDYSDDSYDTTPTTDDSYSDSQTTDSSQEQQSSDSGVVDPQLKAALDSYEEFIDEYVKFLKTYTQTNDPMAMLSEYTQYMTKYSELMQKISELDKMRDQMSTVDLAYYIDWTARIEKKMLEISNMNLN